MHDMWAVLATNHSRGEGIAGEDESDCRDGRAPESRASEDTTKTHGASSTDCAGPTPDNDAGAATESPSGVLRGTGPGFANNVPTEGVSGTLRMLLSESYEDRVVETAEGNNIEKEQPGILDFIVKPDSSARDWGPSSLLSPGFPQGLRARMLS